MRETSPFFAVACAACSRPLLTTARIDDLDIATVEAHLRGCQSSAPLADAPVMLGEVMRRIRIAVVGDHEPEKPPPLRRVTNLRTGEVFWQRSWTFERLRAETLYAPMNGTLRSWAKRRWFRWSWRWNRDPWIRWSAERLAKALRSQGLDS